MFCVRNALSKKASNADDEDGIRTHKHLAANLSQINTAVSNEHIFRIIRVSCSNYNESVEFFWRKWAKNLRNNLRSEW